MEQITEKKLIHGEQFGKAYSWRIAGHVRKGVNEPLIEIIEINTLR